MDDTPNTLYVFPDTNVLVQCKPLGELAWNNLGNFSKIILILARPVIGEIDHQKGGVGRLAKRARVANSLLRRLLDEDVIEIPTKKKGVLVTLQSGDDLKASSLLDDQLDYSTADDKLVGTVHKYLHDHPDHQVLFLSHDTGPLMTAKRLRVPFQQVPDDWILSPETDDDQKQIRVLQEELKRREEREPDCQIEFIGAPWVLKIPRYRSLTETQIATLVHALNERHPCETAFETLEPGRRPFEIAVAQLGGKRFVPVSSEQIHEYQEARRKWVEEVMDFLREFDQKMNAFSGVPWIEIGLINVGTSPALNAEVRVEVMGGSFSLFAPDRELEKVLAEPFKLPKLPAVPKGQWVESFRLGTSLAPHSFDIPHLNFDSLRNLASADVNKFYWKGGRPMEPVQQVSRECGEWRHHDDKEFVRLRLYLGKSDDLPKGAIKVTIRAKNLSQPVQSTQPVRFEGMDLDLLPEAEALIGRI